MFRPRGIKLAAFITVAGGLSCTGETVPRSYTVERVVETLDALKRYDRGGRTAPKDKIYFELSEPEINEYLAYSLKTAPRPGIDSIAVKLRPDNQISARAVIDLEIVRLWKPKIVPDLLRPVLTGKVSVEAELAFEAQNGTLTFTVISAHGPGGDLLPKGILEDIIQSIAARQAEHYDTRRPIPLPFGLRRLRTEPRKVVGET